LVGQSLVGQSLVGQSLVGQSSVGQSSVGQSARMSIFLNTVSLSTYLHTHTDHVFWVNFTQP
jgi:hypothetical protein